MSMDDQNNSVGWIYEIIIEGLLDAEWNDIFCGFKVLEGTFPFKADHGHDEMTILRGWVADQAQLRGMMNKIWDLNLTLVSIQRASGENLKGDNHD
jgi:hypothetical protein